MFIVTTAATSVVDAGVNSVIRAYRKIYNHDPGPADLAKIQTAAPTT